MNMSTWRVMMGIFIASVGVKLLTINEDLYRSTDFEVHRNWMAVTSQLDMKEWYGFVTKVDDPEAADVNDNSKAKMISPTSIRVHSHSKSEQIGTTKTIPLSQWTLDYPPLFAYFEFFLGKVLKVGNKIACYAFPQHCTNTTSSAFDPMIVQLDSFNYETFGTILFMRLSVILSELVGTGAAVSLLELSGLFVNTKKDMEQTITKPMFLMILTMSPTLFIVDHIHFQYNGLLLSMLMISLTLIEIGRPMIGLAVFCILLFMKHLYVYAVPPLGVYLLAKYCINDKHTILTSNCTEQNKKIQCMGSDNIRHFLCFVIISITITVSSVAPFISTNSFTDAWTSLECMIRRLFPFGRGLVHDYHAANIWSLYVTLDKIFSSWIKKPATRGTMRALPDVSPLTSSICVFLAMCPCLVSLGMRFKYKRVELKKGQEDNSDTIVTNRLRHLETESLGVVMHSCSFCFLSSFMFGWHVHEKAILHAIVPLSMLLAMSTNFNMLYLHDNVKRDFRILSIAGLYGVLPLLFRPDELFLKIVLFAMYIIFLKQQIPSKGSSNLENLYIFGFVCLELVKLILFSSVTPLVPVQLLLPHIVVSISEKLPFLPLLLTSLYSFVGVAYVWTLQFWFYLSVVLNQ